ncbi:amidase signature enzyme [Xylaria sp. FL1042]|nr:amidase signature enzyme [Xylaria sp. FL1042]
MSKSCFDVLRATADDLQNSLQTRKITSVQIVEQYLDQICLYEPILHALILARSQLRGPLHGIPIILKRLIDAGMIILAKSNMTEFGGMKTLKIMPGWSPHGGQTILPYMGPIKENERLLGHSARGSSTGSSVSVAAGFSPLAIGVETIGSIITPSTRAALYALKSTVGVQDCTGMYKMSDFYDSPGPMAKCAIDVLHVSEVLLGRSLTVEKMETWGGISVAFLDPKKWQMAEEMCEQIDGSAEQMSEDYQATISKLREHGCWVKYLVEVAETSTLIVDGKEAIIPIAYWVLKNIGIPQIIAGFDKCAVHTLSDIISFNEQHRSESMPEPDGYNHSPERVVRLKDGLRARGKAVLDEVFDGEEVNIIAALGDSPLCVHAAAAGYLIAAAPISTLRYNGCPFGLCLVAKGGGEEV